MITREDVLKAHKEEHLTIVNKIKELQYTIAKMQTIVGEMVESSEVEPTVIRSKTLMPTKDFKEWAKRVREINPNAVVIPCDAEVVPADAVEVVRCKDCKYFELDHFDRINGIPLITAHEVCTKWSGGSKTSKDGFCFMGERRNNDNDRDTAEA